MKVSVQSNMALFIYVFCVWGGVYMHVLTEASLAKLVSSWFQQEMCFKQEGGKWLKNDI